MVDVFEQLIDSDDFFKSALLSFVHLHHAIAAQNVDTLTVRRTADTKQTRKNKLRSAHACHDMNAPHFRFSCYFTLQTPDRGRSQSGLGCRCYWD